MGCIARLGCLILLVILGCIAWLTRGQWLPKLRSQLGSSTESSANPWQPLTAQGAARSRDALARLSRPTGPVFANVSGADAASYVYQELSRQLPPSADSMEAAVINDQLCLRGSVKVSDLGGQAVLGPLASLLGDRDRLQFCGTFHVIHPGLAEYEVKNMRVQDIASPQGAIPRLLAHIERGARPGGLSPDGLPLLVPSYIGDVRVGNGKVTLYKNE